MSDKMHTPMPVAGYKPQSDADINTVNQLKEAEERVLRLIDALQADTGLLNNPARARGIDQRFVALGKTHLQTAFMFLARSVFQPARIRLPEDEPGAAE